MVTIPVRTRATESHPQVIDPRQPLRLDFAQPRPLNISTSLHLTQIRAVRPRQLHEGSHVKLLPGNLTHPQGVGQHNAARVDQTAQHPQFLPHQGHFAPGIKNFLAGFADLKAGLRQVRGIIQPANAARRRHRGQAAGLFFNHLEILLLQVNQLLVGLMPGIAELQLVIAATDVKNQIAHFAAQPGIREGRFRPRPRRPRLHLPGIRNKKPGLHHKRFIPIHIIRVRTILATAAQHATPRILRSRTVFTRKPRPLPILATLVLSLLHFVRRPLNNVFVFPRSNLLDRLRRHLTAPSQLLLPLGRPGNNAGQIPRPVVFGKSRVRNRINRPRLRGINRPRLFILATEIRLKFMIKADPQLGIAPVVRRRLRLQVKSHLATESPKIRMPLNGQLN